MTKLTASCSGNFNSKFRPKTGFVC